MKKKVSAFTILELIIALILASIIIGIGYYGYGLINKTAENYYKQSAEKSRYHMFCKVISSDFNDALMAKDTLENSIVLIGKDSRIIYHFGDKTERYNGEMSEVFDLRSKKVNSVPIKGRNLVSEVFLHIRLDNTIVELPLKKMYSAQELIESEIYERGY